MKLYSLTLSSVGSLSWQLLESSQLKEEYLLQEKITLKMRQDVGIADQQK